MDRLELERLRSIVDELSLEKTGPQKLRNTCGIFVGKNAELFQTWEFVSWLGRARDPESWQFNDQYLVLLNDKGNPFLRIAAAAKSLPEHTLVKLSNPVDLNNVEPAFQNIGFLAKNK